MNFGLFGLLFLIGGSGAGQLSQEAAAVAAPQGKLTPLDRHYTQEDLDRMGQAAVAAVRSVHPTEIGAVPFRFVKRSEMEAVLYGEFRPQMDCQVANAKDADATASALAKTMAGAVLAKFATGPGEVLVVQDNLFRIAKLIQQRDLASEEVMEAVLCHEVVHAFDNHSHPIQGVFALAQGTDHLQAINATIEGHAQYVARKACQKTGNMAGFDLFTHSIDFMPETGDPRQDYVSQIAVAQFSFAYKDGERFIEALVRERGVEAIPEIFQSPPTESILITEPGWFMHPALRPAVPYDLQQALARYEAALDKEDPDFWRMTHVKMLAPQIHAAFSLLPKDRYEDLIKDILECRVLVAQNLTGDGSMISAGLFALRTVPLAKQFVELEHELILVKPEKLKGSLTIVLDKLEKLTREDSTQIEGLWCEQTITVGSTEVRNMALVGYRGQVGTEINFTGVEITKQEAIEAAEFLLQTPEANEAPPVEAAK